LPQLNSYRCHTQLYASLSCSPWQAVCHNWTATDATLSCMPVSHAAHDSLFVTTEQLQMPHTALCQSLIQLMTVCLPQLNSYRYHTQLYARLWNYLSSYNKLVHLCVYIFLCGIRMWKPHVWWFLEMKKLLKLLQQCWVERAGPIAWNGRSYDFTLLDIFWSNVTEHMYIFSPFCLLLMEGHTEIEHFWDLLSPGIVCSMKW